MKKLVFLALIAALVTGCRNQAQGTQAAASTQTPAGTAATTSAAQVPDASQPSAVPPAPPPKPVPKELPAVIATIDDEKVERWELEGAIKGLEARAGAPIPAERRDEIVRGLIDQIVAYHVLAGEARDGKLSATDGEVTARMSQIKGGFPNEQAFQQALTAQGITVEQLQRQTRMGMDIDKVLETKVGSTVKVEDAEVGTFYQQNLQQFAQGESVHASHILITTPKDAPAPAKAAARSKAEDLLKQVKAGGDFAKLAKEQSQDPGSAPGGGDLGFFPKGQTDPAFEAAAFALKPGGVSDVVESQFGYHVIKLHEHRPARTAPLEEVSAQIREYLTNQQRDAKIQAFIEQARARRKVQILV